MIYTERNARKERKTSLHSFHFDCLPFKSYRIRYGTGIVEGIQFFV